MTATAAGIPYEDTDCTADEAVEAVKAVRTTAAWTLRSVAWQLVAAVAATVAEYAVRLSVWATERATRARQVTGIHKDPATGGSVRRD